MRRFLLVILVAATFAVPVRSAAACTCATFDTRRALAEHPAAFIGTVIAREEAPAAAGDAPGGQVTYRFRVDEAVKGDLGPEVAVRSAGDQASCGIAAPADTQVGLILSEQDGAWVGSLCLQPSPERLRRAAQPLPAPDGQLPAALVVGSTYGNSRSVALDGQGRVAALGAGVGTTVAVAVCPGRERIVELFGIREPADGATTPGVGVRHTATMVTEAEHVLGGLRAEPGSLRATNAVACRDREGRDLLLFTRDGLDAGGRARILRLQDGQLSTVWEGPAPKVASFGPAGRAAYLNLYPNGEDLVVIDLEDPAAAATRVQALARLPFDSGPMVASPDGRRIATVAPAANRPSRAVLVDLGQDGGAVTIFEADLGSAGITGEMVWVDNGRVLFSPRLRPAEKVRLYDMSLQQEASWTGWTAERSVAAGGLLYGASQGAVRVAPLETGPATMLRDLEDALVVDIVDVATDRRREPEGPSAGPAGVTTTTTTTPPAPERPRPSTTTTSTRPEPSAPAPTTTTTTTTATVVTPPAPGGEPAVDLEDQVAGRSDRPAPANAGDEGGSGAGPLAALVAVAALAGGAAVWWRRRRPGPSAG